MDMSEFTAPKSDQLNYDDMIAGPITIRITKVIGTGNPDQPVAVHFDGDNGKPWKPSKSMRRVMISAWGIEASNYVGRSITLFGDPKVVFGGLAVGGIRISHLSHIPGALSLSLTVSKAKRAPYRVLPLAETRTPAAGLAPTVAGAGSGDFGPSAAGTHPNAGRGVTAGVEDERSVHRNHEPQSDHAGQQFVGDSSPSAAVPGAASPPLPPSEQHPGGDFTGKKDATHELEYYDPTTSEFRYYAKISEWCDAVGDLAERIPYQDAWDANQIQHTAMMNGSKRPEVIGKLKALSDHISALHDAQRQIDLLSGG